MSSISISIFANRSIRGLSVDITLTEERYNRNNDVIDFTEERYTRNNDVIDLTEEVRGSVVKLKSFVRFHFILLLRDLESEMMTLSTSREKAVDPR